MSPGAWWPVEMWLLKGKRFCEVRRWHLQVARWKDLVELYTSVGPEVEQTWRDFYVGCRASISPGPGNRFFIREPAPSVEGTNLAKFPRSLGARCPCCRGGRGVILRGRPMACPGGAMGRSRRDLHMHGSAACGNRRKNNKSDKVHK